MGYSAKYLIFRVLILSQDLVFLRRMPEISDVLRNFERSVKGCASGFLKADFQVSGLFLEKIYKAALS